MKPTHIFALALVVVVLIVLVTLSGNLFESLNNDQVMLIQDPIDGDMHVYITPGTKPQWFGHVTKYNKRGSYDYEQKIRFNDGGHATMYGTIQWVMPLDSAHLVKIQTEFHNEEALREELIGKITKKCIYMTGPLMSSYESYGDKRNSLIQSITDQIENGVYQTKAKDIKVKDELTGEDKTVKQVEIILDSTGVPARQEKAILAQYDIVPSNFVIENMPYDENVEKQIVAQQQIIMDVKTSVADAKKAEQNAITIAEQGKANAAKQKWDQEAIKAKAVTEAEQKRDVAKLAMEAAGFYKQEQILKAEGDAAYKQKVMAADGALAQKLATYEHVQQMWANALANMQQPIVPQIVTGSNSGAGSNAAVDWMTYMGMKAARDLTLDLSTQVSSKPGR